MSQQSTGRPQAVEKPRPVGDVAARHRSKRTGRQRGCWVYIPAEQLKEAGIDPYAPPPDYRIWRGQKKTVLVQLYEVEPDLVEELVERVRDA